MTEEERQKFLEEERQKFLADTERSHRDFWKKKHVYYRVEGCEESAGRYWEDVVDIIHPTKELAEKGVEEYFKFLEREYEEEYSDEDIIYDRTCYRIVTVTEEYEYLE